MFYVNLLLGLLIGASLGAPFNILGFPIEALMNTQADVPNVPFYSQFYDIHATKWQKLGCGVASLAMLIDFYQPGTVSVDTLLQEGIAAGTYIDGAGWSHGGLVFLAGKYGLGGTTYNLSHLEMDAAFARFEKFLNEGPVIASVHYTFDPNNPIPHLVVINGIDGDTIYYNDPAEASAEGKISTHDFMKGWKKKFIVVRP